MCVFSGESVWDELSTQSESEFTSKPSIADLLTNVATDANEGNRYVTIQFRDPNQCIKLYPKSCADRCESYSGWVFTFD